ncbi:MarR family transcriptional regulator [Halorubrum ezzemoulense]|uniref:MarR family transcriptional regulator n=1 Tax=Halorubrum ezzemoulense TaxID=337243 RepID=UPI00232B5649|nr:MarR family transcriptional regulator [Halorubrum ezzemoulense]MDB2265472.1 MarR family transcriptional regulator [Halorubrum ezzemoulense]MDB9302606.1 MarR family transcriptional regulator [Halorubrum ezzemoulense]
MRYAGEWMSAADDRILEYLSEHESGSPTKMKNEGPIRYSRVQVHRRCKKLAEEGLVNDLGNGVYMITEDGEAYLDGRLDTEDWHYIDEQKAGDSTDSNEDSANNHS